MKSFRKHLVALLLILSLLAQATMAGAATQSAVKKPVTPLPPLPDQYIAQADGVYVLRSSYMLELAILKESATAKDLADATILKNLRIQARDEAIFRAVTQAAAERLKATFTPQERQEAEAQLYAMAAEELEVQDASDLPALQAAWSKLHPTIALEAIIQRALQNQEFDRLKRIQSADILKCGQTIYTECLQAITRDMDTSLQPYVVKASEVKRLLLDLERYKPVLRPNDYENRKAQLVFRSKQIEADMLKIRLQGSAQMAVRVQDTIQKKYPGFNVAPFLSRMLSYIFADSRSCFEVIYFPRTTLTEEETAYVADLAAALLLKAKTGKFFSDIRMGAINNETYALEQETDQAELHAKVREMLQTSQEPVVLTQTQIKELFPKELEPWRVEDTRLLETKEGWSLLRLKGVINAGTCVPWNLAVLMPSYIVPFLDMAFRSVNQWERPTAPLIRYSSRLDG